MHPHNTLPRTQANYTPLSPLSFLRRSAQVYPNRTAIIYGETRRTWAETYARCRRLASAIRGVGLRDGDVVAMMAVNTPEIYEAHFGVPMAGCVLNAINTRLDARVIAYILDHGAAKLLITDREFSGLVKEAVEMSESKPRIIDIDDPAAEGGALIGEMDYEAFLATGDPEFDWSLPEDEWNTISINYTSGTTGNPKGVVYHHRGAYLNAVNNALDWNMSMHPVYLWTLPMFHCNGWTYTWGVTAVGATHVCLRRVDPALIFPLIEAERVTHLCGAPIVLNMLIHAPDAVKRAFAHTVEVATGGAAPPSAVITAMEELGFRVTHLYGLTETYGPATVCAWQGEWDALPADARAARMARQGVHYPTLADLTVADPATLEPVPADGETLGEVMLRGNTVMKGYLKNPEATAAALAGGWFHTGDLAVMHADGYIEVKDRSKDVIISGGENISSLEVEDVLYRHPQVMEAAVVARPDEKWGESPCAFVTLRADAGPVSDADIVQWCREHMASFKIPRTVVFGPLPKTSTGKIQKYVLRERARAL